MKNCFCDYDLKDLERFIPGTMLAHLGIEFTAIGDNFIEARMPVDHRTRQPAGILHGGASVTLAETLGSVAANLLVDDDHHCVGLEINANHLCSVADGTVIGVTQPLHVGRTTQVWEIRIRDEQDRPVCVSRITMAVLAKRR